MRRSYAVMFVAIAIAIAATGSARAALLAKTYEFKAGVDLQIGEELTDGLRLDTVHFDVPSGGASGQTDRTSGVARVEISISNFGKQSIYFGLAVVLLDGQGRLVGAGNGGPRIFPLRPDRQGKYRISFDGVNREAFKATQFKIAVETKR